MVLDGIRGDQITQVRGFADQRLRKKEAPLDPSNRRISMIVQYLEGRPPEEPALAGNPKEAKSEGAAKEAQPGTEELKPAVSQPKE